MTLVLSRRRFCICLWTGRIGSFWSQWRCFNFQQKPNQCLRENEIDIVFFWGRLGEGVGEKVERKVVCVQKQSYWSYK